MPNLSKLVTVALTTLALSSCASQPQRIALTDSNKQHIKSNHVFVNKSQYNIVKRQDTMSRSELPDPLAALGGMTSARSFTSSEKGLIGNLIVKSLENQQASNLPSHLNNQLKKSIGKFPWLHVQKHRSRYNINGKRFTVTTKDHDNTTLFIGTKYAFNPSFSQLKVTAYAKLVQMSVGNNEQVILYRNKFTVVNQLPQPNNSADKNKNRWASKNNRLLKHELKAAGSELAKMITMDIQNPADQVYNTDSKQIAFTDFSGYRNVGHLIRKDRGYYIIGKNNQELCAVNQIITN